VLFVWQATVAARGEWLAGGVHASLCEQGGGAKPIAKKGSQLNQSSGTTTMMVSEPTSKSQHSLWGLG